MDEPVNHPPVANPHTSVVADATSLEQVHKLLETMPDHHLVTTAKRHLEDLEFVLNQLKHEVPATT